MNRVAVIGAGWSGLACALELGRRGCAVDLFDAAPQGGGRARAVDLRIGDRDFRVDNGQHLLVGAYTETLRMMREVGVDPDAALLRLPFEMRYPDGFLLRARRLPAPLHLAAALTATGLPWAARFHVLAFTRCWQRRQWRLADDARASSLFAGAPGAIVARLWRPLCLAALNVELEQASAQMLLTVVRDSLAGGTHSADLLIPRRNLTQIFAAPALESLRRNGTRIRLRTPVRGLALNEGRWYLHTPGASFETEAVVLALPPRRARQLLATAHRPELVGAISALDEIRAAAIATVYLRYAPGSQLTQPLFALLDDRASGRPGQWVFDRGRLDAENDGLLSVVISAVDEALLVDTRALAASAAAQLSGELGLPRPIAAAVLVEKRATIVPAPGLRRPPCRLPLPRLYLAGDAAESEYPSTLEGSVRAGIAAARAIAADASVR